jgi:glycosyltransferase involved in cell wall biosynthesis
MMWALGIVKPLSILLGWLERIAITVCDFWLVPSEERARLILAKHKIQKRYIVYENLPISNGGPNDRQTYRAKLQQSGVPSNALVVMFQGSLTTQRGLEALVEASKSGSFHLVIQGQGNLLPFLREQADKHVTFLSPCSNDEVVSWLSAAEASFVFYENDCLNSAYACSNKFYSSVMAGTPVICNRLPAFEAFAKQYGGVVFIDELNTESIRRGINFILDSNIYSLLRQQMLSARKSFENLSREKEISQAFTELQS